MKRPSLFTVSVAFAALLLIQTRVRGYPLHRPLAPPRWSSLASSTARQMVSMGADTIHTEQLQPYRNDTEKVWSYVYNLQRVRRESSNKLNLIKPAKSLVGFLEHHSYQHNDSIQEPLERAMVQGIRVAASVNDYKLILRLVDAALLYANGHALLEPRILGEAVDSLSKTSASISKIKTVWNKYSNDTFTRPLGPLEVNAMLQALCRRSKLRAALDLYRTQSLQTTDAYSLSILLNALTESIENDQMPKIPDQVLLLKHNGLSSLQSVCWQWNEALLLVDNILTSTDNSMERLNNPVISALLRLNERTSQVFWQHNGPQIALYWLNFMKEHCISPDAVTCTLILSNLGQDYKTAIAVLRLMQKQETEASNAKTSWSLPRPNVYSYSATIAACARAREYETALQLLNEMEQNEKLQVNTVVYNSVLQALVRDFTRLHGKIKKSTRRDARDRLRTVLQLWNRMKDSASSGMNTAPDAVTYNTILASLSGVGPILSEKDWLVLEQEYPGAFGDSQPQRSFAERITHTLLDEMIGRNIARDSTTYRRAVLALQLTGLQSVLDMLKRALQDEGSTRTKLTDVFNAALSVLANEGNLEGALNVFSRMIKAGAGTNPETTIQIIRALGRGQKSTLIPAFLLAMSGNKDAERQLVDSQLVLEALAPLEPVYYSVGISACLLAGDFDSARSILAQMKEIGFKPSQASQQEIARTQAIVALTETSVRRENERSTLTVSTGMSHAIMNKDAPTAMARSAYSVTTGLLSPPASLLSTVAEACASVGMFEEARTILRALHRRSLDRLARPQLSRALTQRDESGLVTLHRSLLRTCADEGNVTAALWFVEDIQYLSRKLARSRDGEAEKLALTGIADTGLALSVEEDGTDGIETLTSNGFGMDFQMWKSLLIAASKSGHWRVCLSTLQFLKPYLEAIRPSNGEDARLLDGDYVRMSSCLSICAKCLEIRSQYGWLVRCIDDWMEWSGRRPPKEAVLAAIRVLSARGRGDEVNSLLIRCTSPPPSDQDGGTVPYELALYVGAITALYNCGLYEAADDAFVAAISRGALPFNLYKQAYGAEQRISLDLHGMNVAVARSAVRIALQQEFVTASWDRTELWDNDMVIVTGRGRGSSLRMRPVLRPEVQRMLVEEFYPPLSTVSVPGNMGALRIPSEDISAWLEHQRQQKGARMLSIAVTLKNLSSGSRLREALSKAAKSENAD